MKALFLILPEKGHVNPYIGPAQALVEKGFDCLIAAPGDIRKQVTASALRFSNALMEDGETAPPMRGQRLVDIIRDKLALREWIKSLLLGVSEDQVLRIRNLIRNFAPDVIVVDPLYYGAVIGSELEEIPWVSMSNSLNPVLEADVQSDLLETLKTIQDEREALFRRYGVTVEFRGCDALSSHLTTAFCTEELVGLRVDVQLLGPSLPVWNRGDEVEFREITHKKLVYASFGSQIYHWPDIFTKLIEAAGQLEVHLILSVGELYHELVATHSSPHLTFYPYAPQLDILKQADLFITHGGANSIMEAFAAGCPRLWISPMCNDQFHQAHYLEKFRLAHSQDLQGLSSREIETTLRLLLASDGPCERMRTVHESYQVNGSLKAAELIQALL